MKNFEQIYNEFLNDKNNELNIAWKEAKKERKKASTISLIVCLIIAAVYLLYVFPSIKIMHATNYILLFLPLIVIEVFAFVIITLVFSKKSSIYNKVYKDKVIKELINNFYDKVEYFPTKEMPEYIYNEGNYDYFESYNIYESEDYFEALLQSKYSIQMAEVVTKKEESKVNKDGEEETTVVTKFEGLFAKITMEKSLNTTLRIMQNGNGLWQNNKLKMDSSEFEKYFDVQTPDKILGMRILTADIMEELVQFQNKTNVKYDIYIQNNNLYLRFCLSNMFEPTNLKNGPIDKKDIEKYFYALNFTYNLANKIITVINDIDI